MNILQLEPQIGKRPNTTDADITICPQCLTVYQPGEANAIAACPGCFNQGHIYRCKSLAECRWWLEAHRARVAAGEWRSESWVEMYERVIEAFEVYYQESSNG